MATFSTSAVQPNDVVGPQVAGAGEPVLPGDDTASQWTLELGRERPSAPWWVEGASLSQPATKVIGEGEGIVIGSGPQAHLRIVDRSVSATHCALAVEDG